MDDDFDKDTFIQAKLGTKQRIAQAKLRVAEKRALEIAARHAEAATTPSPSPLPASPFIRPSAQSISSYAPESNALLRSPTTEVERVERTNSIKELSKKIVAARNSELHELITKMILCCPGAKEMAESFFLSNEAQSDDEEVVNRGIIHAARRENGEGHNANHVTYTVEGAVGTELNEGRMRGDTLGAQSNPNGQTHVPDQPTDGLNTAQEDNPSALYLASHPKHNSIFRNSDAHRQLDLQQQDNQSDSMQIEEIVDNQAPTNIDENSQKDDTATAQGESETALASETAEKTSSNPMNDALLGNVSDTEIINALVALPSNITESRETSAFHTPSRGTPQISLPEVSENVIDTGPSEVLTTDIIQVVKDISARYVNLARAFGSGNFPFDKLASIAAETSRNESAKEFSFESFKNIVDSVRKNIETMQGANANNVALESMTQSVREVSSDLGSPIPMDASGQELARNPVCKDGINSAIQEAIVSAESTDSEEDEHVDVANIISSHYNCDSCRKPIVLPEVFIVSLENPGPTTCLHCKTRKASGIIRRKLGSRVRSNISMEVPTSERDNQPTLDQVGHRSSEDSETANQLPRTVPDNLGSLSESFSEPLPQSVPEVPEEPLVSVEAGENDSGGTPQGFGHIEGDNIKHEGRGDTIIVEIPAWRGPTGPQVPTGQTSANGQSLSSLGKRKVRRIEGEAVYSSPIGPKRRRGRPSKNYQAIVSDSSPASSSPILIAASNQSTQATSTLKKRGRPFRVKLETGEPNKVMEQTWEPKNPEEYTSAIRPISQRMSAKKSREITQNQLSERQDLMEDLVQDGTQDVTRDINHHSKPTKETLAINHSDNGSIPKSRAARRRRRNKKLKHKKKLMAIQRDSGSGHSQAQASEFRTGSNLMTGTMPDNNITSTSLSDTFSAEMDVQGPATEIPVGRGEQSERNGNLSFNGDQEMPQSILEQGSRIFNGNTTSTTVRAEHDNVDDRVTGSLQGNKSGVEKVVGSIARSMNDKSRATSGEGSNIMRNPNEIGNESHISKEGQDKVRDSSSEDPIPAHTEPHPQIPMYPSSFPNIENQQPSLIAEPEPTHTTTSYKYITALGFFIP
ncbi:1d8e8259-fdbf-4c38-b471-9eeb2321668f [Sclerotinia trifoliorum]|uniref:1d8e8259-fdbf-4c38-b471-9eeb2321668f n=1 Tax=Sclerotinia trifoliorum TaxID=28548 RepID=A0A8H2VV33_9HELO|nr:1d8e8259-fdbf-4c38-b471-9eeb2321668f [Sclerotinia trifoliorum]